MTSTRVKKQVQRVQEAIKRDDFRTPDVKKLAHGQYDRAMLDDTSRLLLSVRHGPETACLALEVIYQHANDKSRFPARSGDGRGKLPAFGA